MTDPSTVKQTLLIEDVAQRFLHDNYSFIKHRSITAQEPGFCLDQWQQMAELGWMLLPIDSAFGGLDGDVAGAAVLAKEFGRALYVSPYLASALVSAKMLEHPQTASTLQQQTLQKIGSGTWIIAPALYEPQSRYDLSNIATTAIRRNGQLILNGIKSAVLFANAATHFLVLVQMPDSNSGFQVYSLMRVPANCDGIQIVPYRMHNGGRMGELRLNGVVLSDDEILLSGPEALQAVEHAVDCANACVCAELVGAMQASLELTLDYVKTRTQFNHKLSDFQSVQHRLVDMFMRGQFAESMSQEAVRATTLDDSVSRQMMISAAKCDIARATLYNAEEAVQLHGAMGMMDEVPVGHYLKHIFTLNLLFGDADYHQTRYRKLRLRCNV